MTRKVDFGSLTSPTARKAYRCIWCGETIEQGCKHTRFVGVTEGEWQDWRMHSECYAVHNSGDEEFFEPHSYKRGSGEERTE